MTTTNTQGAADLPKALRLAEEVTELMCSTEAAARTLAAAADELCRLHAESEMRRAALLDEMQKAALAAGQATAAQPAAQQPHRSGCTAGTDEACVQRGCGINCPAVSPRQGVADAPLPEPHFGEGRYLGLAFRSDAYSVAQVQALFASHGQAPAEVSPTAGMNIPQRILHVGGRNNDAGYVEFGSIQAVEALVRQVLRDLPSLAQADSVQEDAASAGFFLLLPQRPKPEAPAGTVGLDWDAYSGAQMLAYGRDCSDAAIDAARTTGEKQ